MYKKIVQEEQKNGELKFISEEEITGFKVMEECTKILYQCENLAKGEQNVKPQWEGSIITEQNIDDKKS